MKENYAAIMLKGTHYPSRYDRQAENANGNKEVRGSGGFPSTWGTPDFLIIAFFLVEPITGNLSGRLVNFHCLIKA